MSYQELLYGSVGNDGNGDTLRDGAAKIKNNFQEIFEHSYVLPTAAALAAEQVPASTSSVFLAGYTTLGDRGGGVFVRDTQSLEGRIPSGDGAYWAPMPDRDGYNVLLFGADPTNTNDSSTAIINAFKRVLRDGGGRVFIPAGTYKIAASVYPGIMPCDVEVVFETGAKWVATSALQAPALKLYASATAVTSYNCKVIGANIDVSGATWLPSTQSATAIDTLYWDTNIIDGADLYGGEEPDNTNSDSGWSPTANNVSIITNSTIRGFRDSGIYAGGDNTSGTTGDGLTLIVDNCTISRCSAALSLKRELTQAQITNNYIYECPSGVIPAEITTPSFTHPVRNMFIEGNIFKKILANAVRFRGISRGSCIDNVFDDWGYEYDGTGSAGVNAYAVVIQGSSELDVSGNTFQLTDWPLDDHRAVLLGNVTINSTLYTQGGHRFSNNIYRDLAYGIVEGSGGTASKYLNEYFDNVTNIVAGSFHVGSVLTYWTSASKRMYVRDGGETRRASPGADLTSTTNVVLTSEESGNVYRNDGATSLVTYTLPGAEEGLEFTFLVSDTDGIRIQAATGDFILSAESGASTSGGYTGSTTAYAAMRLRAINSSSWYAVAETGTWTPA